jgi:hypothetical protein
MISNSPSGELTLSVDAELSIQLGQNNFIGCHQNKAQVPRAQVGIEANRFAHKIVDSAERLNARESATRHDEGQKRLALAGSAFGVSLLQMRYELIADCYCVAKGFHSNAGIFHTREVEEVGAGAKCKDQLVVRQLMTMTVQAVGDRNSLTFEIENLDRTDKRLYSLEQLT